MPLIYKSFPNNSGLIKIIIKFKIKAELNTTPSLWVPERSPTPPPHQCHTDSLRQSMALLRHLTVCLPQVAQAWTTNQTWDRAHPLLFATTLTLSTQKNIKLLLRVNVQCHTQSPHCLPAWNKGPSPRMS